MPTANILIIYTALPPRIYSGQSFLTFYAGVIDCIRIIRDKLKYPPFLKIRQMPANNDYGPKRKIRQMPPYDLLGDKFSENIKTVFAHKI